MSEDSETTEKTFQIYAPGCPDEGMPMTEGQLQAALGEGRLQSCDLVWCDGAWRQLSDVFELPPFELPDHGDAEESEIAVKLSELPAASLRPVLAAGGAGGGLLPRLFRRVVYSGSKRRPLWQLCLGAAVLVALVFFGYCYGLVPLANRLLWRPAYVLVVNPYKVNCPVVFMGQEYTLPGNGTLTFPDLFGRMPRVETMVLTTPWDKSQKKIHVELKAGETVLVNPMGICSFGVLKPAGGQVGVSQADKNAVRAELASNRPPVSALKLGEQGKKVGKGLLLVSCDESNIHSSDDIAAVFGLDFVQLGLKPSAEHLERKGAPGPAVAGRRSCNLLNGVDAGGGVKVRYRKGTRDVAACSIGMEFPGGKGALSPVASFCKGIPHEFREFEPVSGKATCSIKFEEKQNVVVLEFARKNFKVRRNQRILLGSWSYEAVQRLTDKSWTWRWRYSGQDEPKIASLSMELNQKGQLQNISYKETRGKGK